MERPRVIQLITRFIRGGAQLVVFQLAKNLPLFGYDVLIATGPERGKEGDLFTDAEREGIPVTIIPSLRRDVSPLYDISALLEIINLLRKNKPTILHAQTSKAGFLGRIAGRLCRVPVIIYQPRGHIFDGYFSPLKTKFFRLLEKMALRMCDAFVCLTEEEKNEWNRYGFNHPNMIVIHSGVDIERFEKPSQNPLILRGKLGIREKEKVIGFIGRLAPVKGAKFLLQAGKILSRKFENIALLVVGDGKERGDLERLARELEIKASFLGHKEDVVDFYHICDVIAVPSLNEGMGRVIIEAWSAGKAVVGSAVGGIKELIDDGETGLLVPPANPSSLAAAIERLLINEDLREKLGRKGKEKARFYSVSAMVNKTVKLYESLSFRKRRK